MTKLFLALLLGAAVSSAGATAMDDCFKSGEIVGFIALRERAGLPISTAMRDAKVKYNYITEESLLNFAMYVYAPTSLRYRNATADSIRNSYEVSCLSDARRKSNDSR